MMASARKSGHPLLGVRLWKQHLRHCAAGHYCQGRRSWLPSLAASGVEIHSQWYCSPSCVGAAIARAFTRAIQERSRREFVPPRSLPLGLLLHARGELDENTLLEAMRIACSTSTAIGRVLVQQKMATERQIASALAAQSGCSAYFGPIDPSAAARLPRFLQATYGVLPLQFVPAGRLLYLGFRNRPDSSLLVAIETVLQCRPEPAIVAESRFREAPARSHENGLDEICFSTPMGATEVGQVCAEYAFRRGLNALRYTRCADRFWVRFSSTSQSLDVFFRLTGISDNNRNS